ncbi:MAG: hypothetical protein NVS2B16_09390 [Chloroflexota bacterium]
MKVAPAVQSAVQAQRGMLVAATLPGGVSPPERGALQHALKEWFVTALRTSVVAWACLALLSALLAASLIEGKKPRGPLRSPRLPGFPDFSAVLRGLSTYFYLRQTLCDTNATCSSVVAFGTTAARLTAPICGDCCHV